MTPSITSSPSFSAKPVRARRGGYFREIQIRVAGNDSDADSSSVLSDEQLGAGSVITSAPGYWRCIAKKCSTFAFETRRHGSSTCSKPRKAVLALNANPFWVSISSRACAKPAIVRVAMWPQARFHLCRCMGQYGIRPCLRPSIQARPTPTEALYPSSWNGHDDPRQ